MTFTFGEFDGRFLGISLTVNSQQRWDNLKRYALGPDIPQELGSEVEDSEFIESVSCLTVMQHEMRHFHDFLISVFGSHAMRSRLVLALNLPQILASILKSRLLKDVDFLPVPITTWCGMSADEQTAFVADLAAGGLSSRPVALPRIGPDWKATISYGRRDTSVATLSDLIAVCGGYQEKLRDLDLLPASLKDIGLYPVHVWEASALLVQAEELNAASGLDAAQRLLAVLGRPGNRYGAALRWAFDVWPDRESSPVGLAAIIVAWSLFGDYSAAKDMASPVARLAMLWDLFRREPKDLVLPRGEVATLFSTWDRLTSQPSTLDGLRKSIEEDDAFVDSVRDQVDQVADDLRDEVTALFAAYCEYVAARRFMVEAFLATPELYLMPNHYLRAHERWTAPPLKIECTNRVAMIIDDEKTSDWHIQTAWETTEGRPITTIFGPPWQLSGVPHIRRDSAFLLYTMFAVSDVVLGPDRADMTDADRRLAQLLFGNEIALQHILR